MKEQRNIVGIKEGWSEFTLDDGTVIRAKASVTNAEANGKYDPEGRPEYTFSVVYTVNVVSPDALRVPPDGEKTGLILQ